jgi:heparan sulfate 2-O-sulfotransferase HS2ST1
LRKTSHKIAPSAETVVTIQSSKVWQMENEFYEFALENFHAAKKRALILPPSDTDNGGGEPVLLEEVPQRFHYEKIRPK